GGASAVPGVAGGAAGALVGSGDGGGGGGVAVGGGMGSGGGAGVGQAQPLILDYGDVYEGKLYQRRSFVIKNHASMPLEFQLSCSLPAAELNFSLSAVTLKQFRSVNVDAGTRLQVYAHYRPTAKQALATPSISPVGGGGGKADEACEIRERISITCRLVKDFQQDIMLTARCHRPQVRTHVEGAGDAEGAGTYGDSTGILFVVKETGAGV
ncbi:unnamed protein product, partial [Discosporangium mesarthrocarpum]